MPVFYILYTIMPLNLSMETAFVSRTGYNTSSCRID